MVSHLIAVAILATTAGAVKELFTHKEFTDVLAEAGGRPVIIDYYSNSCGPCHMIAPVYRKISKEFAGKAYFRKVDVNRNHQTSSHQGVRSMPTFQFWVKGKKRHQFSGADEYSLREWTRRLVEEADRDDIEVTREALEEFYKKHDPAKATKESIDKIMEKNSKDFATMVKILKKKYGEAPKTQPRPQPTKKDSAESASGPSKGGAPNLKAASLEELKQELERREEDAALEKVEEEEKKAYQQSMQLVPKSYYGCHREGCHYWWWARWDDCSHICCPSKLVPSGDCSCSWWTTDGKRCRCRKLPRHAS